MKSLQEEALDEILRRGEPILGEANVKANFKLSSEAPCSRQPGWSQAKLQTNRMDVQHHWWRENCTYEPSWDAWRVHL